MTDDFFNNDRILHHTCEIFEGEEPDDNQKVRITYGDARPPANIQKKGIILLIHGFPQTSYQFRKVLPLLMQAGYRLIVPNYRGAENSSKPTSLKGYRKTVMAADLHHLIKKHLAIEAPIHVVGHDIGGMIAHAYAVQYPSDTASVAWGECPLPGTTLYDEVKESITQWHFVFQRVTDLPEFLIQGKERGYIQHFHDKLSYNQAGISPADIDVYAKAYAMPGGIRASLNVYRMFNDDALENIEFRNKHGKCQVKCLSLNGDKSFLAQKAEESAREFYEDVEVATLPDSGHYIAEENPSGFAERVLEFVGKHQL